MEKDWNQLQNQHTITSSKDEQTTINWEEQRNRQEERSWNLENILNEENLVKQQQDILITEIIGFVTISAHDTNILKEMKDLNDKQWPTENTSLNEL
jgi:hypothetical protein